ncbi:MAG: phosphate/phosphite/phosphonate ABC transporter substrate-binding protein [Nitrospinota bacterium]
MSRLTRCFCVFLGALLPIWIASAPSANGAAPLRIALVPIANPERLIDGVRPAMKFLEKEMGRKIRYFITLNYSAAVEAMASGKADISFMPPLPYVLAHHRTGAEAILGEIYRGKYYYQAKIFVRKDSGIKKLEDLKGKTIAYVDPISSSGFMYPHDIFVRKGLAKGGLEDPEGGFFRRVYFAGGDEQTIRSVLGRFVDAAGVSEFSLNLIPQKDRGALTAIAVSERIPSHNVVARKGLDSKTRARFIAAMLKLNEPPNRKYLGLLYGTDGYVKVVNADYKSVADMARRYGFLRK